MIEARGEANDMEGFFCILNFKGYNQKQIPKSTQITVTAYAPSPNDPNNLKNALYSEKVLTFDISYISKIKIESYYRNGVTLNRDHRTESIKIFSNTNFNVHVENQND
jgi:hypothetical protein